MFSGYTGIRLSVGLSVYKALVILFCKLISFCCYGTESRCIDHVDKLPGPGGSVLSVLDSRPGGCEFDPQLRRLFFMENFRRSPLQKL